MHYLICIALSQPMQKGRETALHAACNFGHVNVASILLQDGAVVDSPNNVRLLYVSIVNSLE